MLKKLIKSNISRVNDFIYIHLHHLHIMKSESQIQAEIIVWFRNNYTRKGLGLIFSVPNEATYQNKNFKTSGTLMGVSDLIVVLKGTILFVEVKNESNKQSYAQLQFEQAIIDLGFKYTLVRSLCDFCDVLNQFESSNTSESI